MMLLKAVPTIHQNMCFPKHCEMARQRGLREDEGMHL